MARLNDEKSKLIQILEEAPFISYACKKVGLGRATFYRWIQGDFSFRRDVERAMRKGRLQCNEVAELGLMKNIKNGTMDAIKFYLTHNDKRYTPKRSIFVSDPMSEKERERYEWTIRNHPIDPQRKEQIRRAWNNWRKIFPNSLSFEEFVKDVGKEKEEAE